MRWTAQQFETYKTRRAACALSVPSRPNKRRDQSAQRWAGKEIDIHTAVVDHLRLRGRPNVHWHHPATGELCDTGKAAKLARMGTTGLAVLVVVVFIWSYFTRIPPLNSEVCFRYTE